MFMIVLPHEIDSVKNVMVQTQLHYGQKANGFKDSKNFIQENTFSYIHRK